MNVSILFYTASFLLLVWGISHLFPTKNVVRGFGEISADNKNIIAMEWITEGASLIFIGTLICVVTLIGMDNSVSQAVYWLSFIFLNVLSIISLFTGFKISFLPFKLCPVIFTGSSLLILAGVLLG